MTSVGEEQALCSKNNGYYHLFDSGQPEHNYEKHYTLKEGDVFFEGGAFWGRYGLIASKKVGERGKVILVEPSPLNILTIEAMIRHKGLRNVVLVKRALWITRGRLPFCVDGNPSGHKIKHSGEKLIEVETDTIDNILEELRLDRANLLAMDIEGAEAEVVKSINREKVLNVAIAAYHLGSVEEVNAKIMNVLIAKGYRNVRYEDGVVYGC
jgi:FkbM family methyltransferase